MPIIDFCGAHVKNLQLAAIYRIEFRLAVLDPVYKPQILLNQSRRTWFSPEEDIFREEVRQFVAEKLPAPPSATR